MGVSLCRASVSPRLHSARSVVTLLSSPTVPRLLAGSIRSLAIFLLEWPIWIGLRACVERGGFGFSGGSGAAALEGWASKNWVTERSYEKNILGLRRIDDAGIFRGLGATRYQG